MVGIEIFWGGFASGEEERWRSNGRAMPNKLDHQVFHETKGKFPDHFPSGGRGGGGAAVFRERKKGTWGSSTVVGEDSEREKKR